MRLGARWRVGDPPHPGVPESLHREIAAQEHAHPDADAWTLTWLEGLPRCELDDLVTVELTASGDVRVTGADESDPDDDDDWLR